MQGAKTEKVHYLDTSALVKRYVEEPGSKIIDEIYRDAYKGVGKLAFSCWNIAEAAVVLDKYERKLGLDARKLLRNLLRESSTLSRLRRLLVVSVSPLILRASLKLVLKHHIYAADALQLVSAKSIDNCTFVTGDKELARVAKAEGLNTVYTG
ncbi:MULTISPECIES: type II toxin-antitoxin system VapC family toxin [Candidatus Korarchaeia]|uniref:type II toxin-antitoxin system VapC family toxin n=1 Tax=Candidatus Korarchaeia TaxID=3342163 RepID=UPI0013874497|nr:MULTISPECIES: type II toxin-antitoxin system VapC family toxin [Candidatus Korarchaeota]